MSKKSKILIVLVVIVVIIISIAGFLLLRDSSIKRWCWAESKNQNTGKINKCTYYNCRKEHLIFKFAVKLPSDYLTSCINWKFNELNEEPQEVK